MKDTTLYSAHDIDKLRQKISAYRDTLTTLKTGNSMDSYLSMRSEFNHFKEEISKLGGAMEIMDEKQSRKIEEYAQQAEKISLQIGSLNETVEELNQDLSIVRKKLVESDSTEETSTTNHLQDALNTITENEDSEVNLTIEETAQIKQQTDISPTQSSNLPPTYKQLRNFINTAKNIQEVQTGLTSTENTSIQRKYQEEQKHFSKQTFPSNSRMPHQTYNRFNSNTNMQPVVNMNHTMKRQTPTIKINQSAPQSFTPTISHPDKNETELKDLNNTHPIVPIEEIEVTEISNELKQQDTNSKETLSFLKFFKKKN